MRCSKGWCRRFVHNKHCSSIKDFKGCVPVHIQKEPESQGAENMGIVGIRKRILFPVTGEAADLPNVITVTIILLTDQRLCGFRVAGILGTIMDLECLAAPLGITQ
jgi:hypothetical protein